MNIIPQLNPLTQYGKYDVLLSDCPWEFVTRGKSSAKTHYKRMTLKDLEQLPVADRVGDNAALFFWVVDWLSPTLQENIVNAWGFTYRTKAWSWLKANKSGMGFFFGRGFYTRGNQEDCWLCVRGSMPVVDHSISKIIYAPISAHSRKPDEQYRKIEALYPGRRYLEMFARRTRPGWSSIGNAIDGRDIRDVLKVAA